ncbi:MAG: flagellar hook-basal body protein [Lachnospiraceae bacterium]|nr:flagellar hook-basal body protein [Lachnospiraceae bacterium]
MLRSLYTGWTGMYTQQKRLDVISNNMANVTTVGYKKEFVTSQSFNDILAIKIRDNSEGWRQRSIGDLSPGAKIGEIYTDYTQGSLRQTDNTFDIGIEGKGFFKVNVTDIEGNTYQSYTRAGQFHMTNDGYIVDANGNHLQSEAGDFQVPVDARQIVIDGQGYVYADDTLIDRIELTDFEDYEYLKKFQDTYYRPVDGATEKEPEATLRQGYTEQSNVMVVNEMVDLIATTRAYEANQKVIKAADSVMEQAATSVGRIG